MNFVDDESYDSSKILSSYISTFYSSYDTTATHTPSVIGSLQVAGSPILYYFKKEPPFQNPERESVVIMHILASEKPLSYFLEMSILFLVPQ